MSHYPVREKEGQWGMQDAYTSLACRDWSKNRQAPPEILVPLLLVNWSLLTHFLQKNMLLCFWIDAHAVLLGH